MFVYVYVRMGINVCVCVRSGLRFHSSLPLGMGVYLPPPYSLPVAGAPPAGTLVVLCVQG